MRDIHVKFSQDLTHPKLLKSVNFYRGIQQIKRWTCFGDTGYVCVYLCMYVITGSNCSAVCFVPHVIAVDVVIADQ